MDTEAPAELLRACLRDPVVARERLADLFELLASPDEDLAGQAAACLEDAGLPPVEVAGVQSVTLLLSELSAPNALRRYWAATLCGRLGPAAEGAVPTLTDLALSDPDSAVRERAILALGEIGVVSPETTAVLERIMQEGTPRAIRLARAARDKLAAANPAG